MRRGISSVLITLALGALALAAGAPAAGAQGGDPPTEQEIGLLFTQTAKRGSLERVKGAGDDARYALALHRVARQTVWFQDRPGRQAGHIPTRGFVRSWSGFGFSEDRPNAALTLLDAPTRQDTVVLTLGKPRYHGPTRTLRYPARILDAAVENLHHFEPQRDERVARAFEEASLFIDDASGPVLADCVIQPYAQCPGADLSGANLSGANLSGANLSGADLSRADLSHAGLSGANLFRANLSGANLTQAGLFNAYLPFANLSGANLFNAGLSGAELSRADLSGANLYTVVAFRADFTLANLSEASLVEANLAGADLTYVTLFNADLFQASLFRANLGGARYCGTRMPDGSINNDYCGQ